MFVARLRPGMFWHTSKVDLAIKVTQNHLSQSFITHSLLMYFSLKSTGSFVIFDCNHVTDYSFIFAFQVYSTSPGFRRDFSLTIYIMIYVLPKSSQT